MSSFATEATSDEVESDSSCCSTKVNVVLITTVKYRDLKLRKILMYGISSDRHRPSLLSWIQIVKVLGLPGHTCKLVKTR